MRYARAADDAPAGLGELLACLLRAKLVLSGFALAGLLLAALLAALSAPAFQARATILIEQDTSSGLLGDLAMLASLASAPATASELSVLESRTLAETVLSDGVDEHGAWDPLDERRVGLSTLVEDRALRPLALLRRALFDAPPPDEPLVLPPRSLLARATEVGADAPTRIALEFLSPTRVRLSEAGLLAALGLAARHAEEREFRAREPFPYRGLTLALEPQGECTGARFTLEYLPHREALERIGQRLEVRETALNSGVIEVSFRDSDPRRAARTVNALCRGYLDSLAQRGQRKASRTVEYVQGLLDEEARSFERAQDQVLRLQQQSPELIAPEGAATTLIEQMAGIEVERVQLELARRAFQEIVAALDAGDGKALARIDSTLNVGVLVDPVTNGLLAELARLEAQASTLGADLKDEHPLVAQNRAAQAGLLARTRAQLDSRLAGLRTRDEELSAVRAELHGRLAEMPAGMRDLAEARVELSIHRELVPYLIRSLQGAEITRSTAETRADLIDPAVPPESLAAPDLAQLAELGLLAGLAAGVAFVFVREPRRGRVHTGVELAAALGAERVLELERLDTQELCFQKARAGPAAEAIRLVRAALRFAPDGAARKRVGVCALENGAAASTLAAELAFAFGGEGRRTLLVEADLAQPRLAARLALARAAGLAEHLERGQPWQELVQPLAGGPDVLCAGSASTAALDLLARPEAERVLAEAAARYDAVVVALPAAEVLPGTPALAHGLDVLCLVHRARTRPRARVRAAAERLRGAGARALVGVLLHELA